jgi:hypothetical protein
MVVIQKQKMNPKLAIVAPYENGLGFTIFYEGALQENTIFWKVNLTKVSTLTKGYVHFD